MANLEFCSPRQACQQSINLSLLELPEITGPKRCADESKARERSPSLDWEKAFDAASKFLEKNAEDPSRQLNASEKAILKELGKAFLKNDVYAVQNILRAYQKNPAGLSKSMWWLSQDLRAGGVVSKYDVVPTAYGKAGTFKIHFDNSNSYLELSSDPRKGAELLGPLTNMKPNSKANELSSDNFIYDRRPYSGIEDFLSTNSVFAARLDKVLIAMKSRKH